MRKFLGKRDTCQARVEKTQRPYVVKSADCASKIGLCPLSKIFTRRPSGDTSTFTGDSSWSFSCWNALSKSSESLRSMFNSTTEAESKFPLSERTACASLLGIRPVESLVREEKGFLKERSTASLIFSS